MVPNTISVLFFISCSLGAKDGGNVLLLRIVGYSGVTGITLALLDQFQELAWIVRGLFCLALIDGRSVAIQEARTHDQAMVPDTFFFPLASWEDH